MLAHDNATCRTAFLPMLNSRPHPSNLNRMSEVHTHLQFNFCPNSNNKSLTSAEGYTIFSSVFFLHFCWLHMLMIRQYFLLSFLIPLLLSCPKSRTCCDRPATAPAGTQPAGGAEPRRCAVGTRSPSQQNRYLSTFISEGGWDRWFNACLQKRLSDAVTQSTVRQASDKMKYVDVKRITWALVKLLRLQGHSEDHPQATQGYDTSGR